ncbi:MAG: Holliday junction resolvase RuvX [Candidatus Planktophila sp.]
MQRGRRLAFDYGDVRIGVAACDPDAILASPVTTLKVGARDLNEQLQRLFDEYEPIAIYIGKPSNMDGSSGSAVQKANAFGELLATLSDTPIVFIDERMSTLSAAKNMRESGVSARDAKSRIDQAAAVAILEFALSIEKYQ